MSALSMVHMQNIKLPEFDKKCKTLEQNMILFTNYCEYNIILGVDFLTKIKQICTRAF